MTWRARRDACRPIEDILAMSPVRRERALAVRKAAEQMSRQGADAVTPHGRIEALRVVLGAVHGGDPADDWAERHRTRERERMRRRAAAGDPKLIEEQRRGRLSQQTPEARARRASCYALEAARRAKGRRPMQAARSPTPTAAQEALKEAEREVAAWAALLAETDALAEKAARMGVTLPGL